jgi:prolyl oligopeptidase
MPLICVQGVATAADVPPPPVAEKGDVVDTYFGVKVADPYRWLEDVHSDRTQSYAKAQDARFRQFVAGGERDAIRKRLTELTDYPRVSAPFRYGTDSELRLTVSRNTGLQNQDVIYVRDGSDGKERLLIDPNKLSADGTVALSGIEFTTDGKLLAYGLSVGGSDQKEIHVRNVDTGEDLPDVLKWCRFAGVAWKKDNSGFFYNKYPTPGTVPAEEETLHCRVYFHKLGTEQAADTLVYERPDDPVMSFGPQVTEDGSYLFLDIHHGTNVQTRLYYRHGELDQGDFVKLLDEEDAEYRVIDNIGDALYLFTNKDASRGRVIAIDPAKPNPSDWKTIIPQTDDAIDGVQVINNQLVVTVMRDAHQLIRIYNLDGSHDRDVPLPEIGSVGGINGMKHDAFMYLSFTSMSRPLTNYRYDFKSGKLEEIESSKPPVDPSKFETDQVFYSSADGTKVPMFIVHKKGMQLDGTAPTILYAYGGFAISTLPRFSSTRAAWLEQGGVYAIANIRGGAEYGEAWHQAAMLENRQRAFDDFEAAAKYLVEKKYTRVNRLAIEGGSNGGLLVATCVVQRPDLFGAVLCHVPVIDMMRYNKMGIGHFWVGEYGDASHSQKEFEYLHAYSPMHNVKEGQLYPPILITTGDGDDRVVPSHPLKFCATLQEKADPKSLVFLRFESKAGHGGGKPIAKVLDEVADGYEFLAKVFGLQFELPVGH